MTSIPPNRHTIMTPTAIVTGASKGIGRAVALMLASRGYDVIGTFHTDNDAAQETISMAKTLSGDIHMHAVDQANRTEWHRFIDHYISIYAPPQCIVCNAGCTIRKPMDQSQDCDWDHMMEVMLNSHYILIRRMATLMPINSRIIFTGSQMAISPHATVLAYGVAKAAVHALAKNLVKEFAEKQTTVNVVAPGFVETEWQKDKPAEIRQRIAQKTAIHRFASIGEIISAYEYCLDNAFVNGAVLEVNGGYDYR